MTTEEKINNIINVIKKYKDVSAYLFGSTARGQETSSSDFDVLLVTSSNALNANSIVDEVSLSLFPRDYSLDLLAYTQKEVIEKIKWNTFFQNIAKEGKLFYGKDVIRMG